MFFKISNKKYDNFSNFFWFDQLCVSTDPGWTLVEDTQTKILYKGYVDYNDISNILHDNINNCTGNFTVFEYNKNTKKLQIKTGKTRAYRIYSQPGQFITNFEKTEYPIWSDNTLTIGQQLTIGNEYNNIIGNTDVDTLDYNGTLDYIDSILLAKTKSFLETSEFPLKVFLTGGVDCTLVYSYISKLTNDYKFITELVIEFDEFICKNLTHVRHNVELGTQIHCWNEPCSLMSGAPGDEFLLRNPLICQIWCDYHGYDLYSHLDDHHDAYMYKFFKKHMKPFDSSSSLKHLPKDEFIRELCNRNVNDPQHWHLGNTLTWTPLRDLDIFKQCLALSFDDGIKQVVNGQISKDLIARNNPELLSMLSKYKNNESFGALIPFYRSKGFIS